MQDIHQGFRTVDQTTDVDFLFRFLDVADATESVRGYRQRMLDLTPTAPGQRILDVGCGIGTVAMQLAEAVGSSGQVVGVDKNEVFIREAQRRAVERSLPVAFQVGDAARLELPDQSFDVVRTERTLMYLDQPERALDEMMRVLRPGGQIVIFEFDYDGTMIDAPNRELTRRIVRIISDSVASSSIGRQAQRLFKERGLQEVTVIPQLLTSNFAGYKMVFGGTLEQAVQTGQLDAAELADWWSSLEQAEQAGHFFVGLLGFVVYGHKPDTTV
ncbi:MAG TPA: methyltransferase domain-containing protein [Herpetosiphonaceae bacterium]